VPAVAVKRMEQAFTCVSRCKRWEGGLICQDKKTKRFFGINLETLRLVLFREKRNFSRRDKILRGERELQRRRQLLGSNRRLLPWKRGERTGLETQVFHAANDFYQPVDLTFRGKSRVLLTRRIEYQTSKRASVKLKELRRCEKHWWSMFLNSTIREKPYLNLTVSF